MTENYLPLALNAWEYCPRRFYLEYQLGEMEDNEHIIGRYLHRNIDEEGIREGIPWFIVISGSGAIASKSAALMLLKNGSPTNSLEFKREDGESPE